MKANIKAIVFDWGDTLMLDFPEFEGPMVNWPHLELIPGVAEALAQLYQQLTCCVASNAYDSDADLMEQALEKVGIRRYFHHFLTSQELGVEKPDPRFFKEVAQRLEIKPSECITVGNNYDKDIVPAKTVGMRTIWLSRDKTAHLALCADAVMSSMDYLPAAIMELLEK